MSHHLCCLCRYITLHHSIWVNYYDLTATSPWMMVSMGGNHPFYGCKIQVRELVNLPRLYVCHTITIHYILLEFHSFYFWNQHHCCWPSCKWWKTHSVFQVFRHFSQDNPPMTKDGCNCGRNHHSKSPLVRAQSSLSVLLENNNWLVVTGTCFIFQYLGNVIIPIDELHHFSEG